MGQGADECPRVYDQPMTVREHIQLKLDAASRLRWLVMVVLAAALVSLYPEHPLSMIKRLGMFAVGLLYLWSLGVLTGILLGAPMARIRCPRCTGKLTPGMRVSTCPHCNVSFDAIVRRDWPHTPTARSPSVIHSRSLRIGQLGRR
jgi:hypothetical protein